jgi:hypothetical protein
MYFNFYNNKLVIKYQITIKKKIKENTIFVQNILKS